MCIPVSNRKSRLHSVLYMAFENAKYTPGDLTDPDKVHPTHYALLANQQVIPEIRTSENGYPTTIENLAKPETVPSPDNAYKVEEMYRKHKEMLSDAQQHNQKHDDDDVEDLKQLFDASTNFHFAKKLHKENLEHEPLPDTVMHRRYMQTQMQRAAADADAGLAIEERLVDSRDGIGYKGHLGHGPHKCTKMKVYRPKTSSKTGGYLQAKDDSICSFDRKWRFIRQEKVSPIELALCWDLTPANVKDEPIPPVHIDGSNGSQAPAVFAMVHTPKDAAEDMQNNLKRCDGIRGCATDSTPEDSIEDHRPKTSWHKRQNQTSELLQTVQRSNSAKFDQQKAAAANCCGKRLCVACELKNLNLSKPTKAEYKQAFKAGIPQNIRTSVSSSNASGNNKVIEPLRIPKPRDPYVKKSYNIESLRPPFCLRKGKREEYPDHWRLASVYQHSYKPLPNRKKPLLASIYK